MIWHSRADRIDEAGPASFWPADGTASNLKGASKALVGPPPDPQKAEQLAMLALQSSPLNVVALRTLARAADGLGQKEQAEQLYERVAKRTKRDLPTIERLTQAAATAQDYGGVVDGFDLLLRQTDDREHRAQLISALVSFTATPAGNAAILAKLRDTTPPWKAPFLDDLARNGQLGLFPEAAAANEASPPDLLAWRRYLQRLIDSGQSRDAYALWVGLLPAEKRDALPYLYDGDFSTEPDNLAFGWNYLKTSGAELAVEPGAGPIGGGALRLTFVGPTRFAHFWQMLILDSGAYTVKGSSRLESLKTSRGLRWRLYCYGQPLKLLGESDTLSGSHDWAPFSFDVTIPVEGCPVQMLRLEHVARIPAESDISGRAYFGDLGIARDPSGSM